MAGSPGIQPVGLFQQAHRVRAGTREPLCQPCFPVVLPEFGKLPAFQIEQVALFEAAASLTNGHEEIAAQDFLGGLQDHVTIAVAQNRRNHGLMSAALFADQGSSRVAVPPARARPGS